MRKFTTALLSFVAFLPVFAAPAVASAAPVSVAVTCSGTGCDNRDPAGTGCDDSAITVDTQTSPKGTFLLRYSTVCHTNWVHVGSYAGGSTRGDGKLELHLEDHDRRVSNSFLAPASAGTHWGNMLYSPGDNCAVGAADWNGGTGWEVVLTSSGC
jgi:hypothetical protein